MRTLILPDCHLRWPLQDKIVRFESPDNVIHMGDTFDQFYDSPELNADAAKWLKKRLHDPKWTFVESNHNIHYRLAANITRCSGFTKEKFDAINSILTPDDWARQKWYHVQDNILFTHAGLHSCYAPKLNNIKDVVSKLDQHISFSEIELKKNMPNWLYGAGVSRGGLFPVGGILWCDESEFKPIKGVSQIFGHTPSGPKLFNGKNRCFFKNGQKFNLNEDININLDSREGSWYGVIEDQTLTVRKFDLLNN